MAGLNPLEGIDKLTLADQEEEVNGHPCYVLELTFKGEELGKSAEGVLREKGAKELPKNIPFRATGGTQHIWIDVKDFLIRKQRLDMTMNLRATAKDVFGEQVPASELPEALDKTVILTYSEVHLDEALPDSSFTYTVPEGAKVVEHLDFGTVLDQIMGP
jgi:outer membrane lipoprotein-sorting protein